MNKGTHGFVKGDFDGFVGLFIDNLVNIFIIAGLCLGAGMSGDLVYGTIIPATAISVLSGNLFFSWQARKLARKEGRDDVTALPYGINTVTVFAFFSFIIIPVFLQTGDAELAWKVGVVSALISGIFEGIGAFWGDAIRKITPRAALLAALAGVAIAFISLDHTVKMWDKPYITMIPLALVLIEYFSGSKLPFRIPAGLYALILGGMVAWSIGEMKLDGLQQAFAGVSFYMPVPAIKAFQGITLANVVVYLSISIPMGIFSFFGTLQNLESAAAAGDNYDAPPVLAMNGIGTIIGALLGSPFPTTVYIGHPGWKGMGARHWYSTLNGIVVAVISLTGLVGVVSALVPLEAGYPILLWIGVIITAQAYQTTPVKHAPAVALGLMPALSAWGYTQVSKYIFATTPGVSSSDVASMVAKAMPDMQSLSYFGEGSLFTGMILAAIGVFLIEKDFLKAWLWSIPLPLFTYAGFIHSSKVGWGMRPELAAGYGLFSLTFFLLWIWMRFQDSGESSGDLKGE